MHTVKTADDLTDIKDPLIEKFLHQYAHYIIPRKNPITIEREDNTVKIGDKLIWENNRFRIRGRVLGDDIDAPVPEETAKFLLMDAGDATELLYAAAVLGGAPKYTTKTKAYITFDRITLLFTTIQESYYLIAPGTITTIRKIEDIKTALEEAKKHLTPEYDHIIYGQSSITYIKNTDEYTVAVKYSENDCSLTIKRKPRYSLYPAGEILHHITFEPAMLNIILDVVANAPDPYEIIKKTHIVFI